MYLVYLFGAIIWYNYLALYLCGILFGTSIWYFYLVLQIVHLIGTFI